MPISIKKPLFLSFILGLAFIFFSISSLKAQKLEKVTLKLKWKHQFQFAGYYAAKEKGFYADQGLSVRFKERTNLKSPAISVLTGQADYGVADSTLVFKYLQGKPVRILASIFQHSPLVLVSKADSGILGPEDLSQTKVMTLRHTDDAAVMAMLKETEADLEQIKFVPHSFSLVDFIQDRVQALLAYQGSETFKLRKSGFDLNILRPLSYGIDFYGDNLFTTAAELKEHPDRTRRFVQASLKGWRYALENKDEIIELILKKYAFDAEPKELEHESEIVDRMCSYPEIPLGKSNLKRYQQVASFYQDLGYGSDNIKLAKLISNPGRVNTSLNLTPKERDFIRSRNAVSVAVMNNFPPFSYTESGKHNVHEGKSEKKAKYKGFTVDLLQMLEDKTGLKIEPEFNSWTENYNKFKSEKVDMITGISYTQKRTKFTRYTDPYYTIPTVVYTRKDFGPYSKIQDLFGKKVAIEKDIYYKKALKKYKQIEIVEIVDTYDMMKALSFNRVDAVITNMNIGNFLIKKLLLDNLKLAGEIDLKEIQAEDLRIGIQKDLPLLHSIMQKGLEQISDDDLLSLQSKWVGASPRDRVKAVSLKPEEKRYLANLNKGYQHIRIGIQSAWKPMEYLGEQGNPQGIILDLLKKAARNLGLPVLFKSTQSLEKGLQDLRKGKVDLISALPQKAFAQKDLALSKPYLSLPLVIASKSKQLFINNLKELDQKQIGLPKGLGLKKIISQKHPEIKIREYNSVQKGLKGVSSGEIFGFVDILASVGTCMQKNNFVDLKIAGKMDIQLNLCMAGAKDRPVLISLLNKALLTLSQEEKESTLNKWKSIKVEKSFNYMLLWKVLAGAALVLLAVLYWNRRLNLLNNKLIKEIRARKSAESKLQETLEQVQQTSEQIALLLNNSGQGFLLIDQDLRIDPHYSRECINIFQTDPAGEKIQDLLFPEQGFKKEHFASTLSKVLKEEDDFKQETIISLLPSKFQVHNKHLQVEYKPLSDRQMTIIITDISEKVRLEQEVQKEHKRLSFIVTALENKNDLLGSLADYENFFKHDFHQLLETTEGNLEKLNQAFRKIHTYKGVLNQYELPNSPEILHKIEGRLSDIINNHKGITLDKLSELVPENELQKALEKDKEILIESLGQEFLSSRQEATVPKDILLEIEGQIKNNLKNQELDQKTRENLSSLFQKVKQVRFKNLKTLLGKYPKYLQQLAERMEKSVHPVHIFGKDFYVDPDYFDPFIQSLVHVFRNSLAHGIESPDERAELNKDEHGEIRCHIDQENGHLILCIADDGQGIDQTALKDKALKSGNYTEEGLFSLTEKEGLNLIFSENISTVQEVDQYSGRGMGLSAVKNEITKLKGSIQVKTAKNQGTEFIFYLPMDEHVLETIK